MHDVYSPAVPSRRPHPAERRTAAVTSDDVPADGLLLESALSLAGKGWRVFPCAPGGKRPAVRGNWQDLATSDLGRVRDWWAGGRCNIGVACGPSGLVVIDLDVCSADGRDDCPGPASGTRSLAALCEEHGQAFPPATYAVDTPSGGSHLYYSAPCGAVIRNSAGRLGRLIDVRAEGGYVVGAGSRISAKAYAVRDPRAPAPLPSWIAALLRDEPGRVPLLRRDLPLDVTRGSAYAMAALREETRLIENAPRGTRNDTLNRAAFNLGQLAAAGMLLPLGVVTALEDAAQRAGLPVGEARRTIASGMSAGTRKPRGARLADEIGMAAGGRDLASRAAFMVTGGSTGRTGKEPL